jgi:hypothetical protein
MYKYLKKIFVALVLVNASLHADLPQPYQSVHTLPQTPYFVLDSYVFFSLISENNAAVIVDVDSHDGSVARFIAQQASNLPALQKVFSVSMWQSEDPSQKHLYQRFLSNIIHEETTDWIVPIRMGSLEAANALNLTADFISIVGKNDENAIYNEILAWYPHLSNSGIISGNNWIDHSVQVGVVRAAAHLEVNLQLSGNIWYLQKNIQ